MKNKYEEAQGLTEEMVRAALTHHGFTEKPCQNYPACKSIGLHAHHFATSAQDFVVPKEWDNGSAATMMWCTLSLFSAVLGVSMQALLRVINPRLRKGCPSQAARSAHPGHWLAVDPAGRGFIVRFDERRGDDPGFEVYRSSGDGRPQNDPFHDPGCSYNVSDFRGGLAAWSFWPADDSANKVPWPEKDGVML